MKTPLAALLLTTALTTTLTTSAVAQETYWIANRASMDIMEVSPWGSVLRRINMNTALRSAHVAPDGKIWVVRFIQSTFDIVNPTTGSITSITSPASPFDVAFDDQGTAWMTMGSLVVNYDANGQLIQSYTLPLAAALGITIDTGGNKWIAHRVAPASVSRIDPTGAIANFPLAGPPSTFLPVRAVADFRGLLQPSHIWVVGDGPSHLVELNDAGLTLNDYLPPATALANLAVAPDGNLWTGNTGGTLLEIDSSNGSVLATYQQVPSSVLGISFDPAGNLWVTQRLTFSGVGPPCEVRRVNRTTGAIEVPGVLQFGSFVSSGTQSALSTPYTYSLVAAPFTDLDGDGDANFVEVQNGTSPTDPMSNSNFHVKTGGTTSIGSSPTIDVATGAGTFWMITFAFGRVPVGSGYTDPAFVGEFGLDPSLTLPVTMSGVGPTSRPFVIPNDPSFQGIQFFMQGLHAGPPALSFTNISGLLIW